MNKLGQEVVKPGVDLLIILIALFILIFVVLIPPGEKDKLLGDGKDVTPPDEQQIEKSLLEVSPGRLTSIPKDTINIKIPSVELYSEAKRESSGLATSFIVTRNIFKDSNQKLTFVAPNDLEAAGLFFRLTEQKGDLIIKLNNRVIYDDSPDGSSLIVNLPIELTNQNNLIEFKVKSPVLAFWRTYKYKIEDLELIKTLRKETLEDERTFTLSSTQLDKMQQAILQYFIYCAKDQDSSFFKVFLNKNILHTGYAFCNQNDQELDIPLNKLRPGVNTLRFGVSEGSYRIENINIETKIRERDFPTYDFSINQVIYDRIQSGDDLKLKLGLPESGRKQFMLTVNEVKVEVDTTDKEFKQDINNYVRQGTNTILIVPRDTLEISKLIVQVEK